MPRRTTPLRRSLLGACLLALVALPSLGAPATSAPDSPTTPATTSATTSRAPAAVPARAVGSLTVTPVVHVAGQALTFAGSFARPGRRAIHLQFHMNRPGDRWTDVKGSDRRTDARGRYRFRFPAPAMFDISYRVVAGPLASRPRLFYARPQAVTLSVDGEDQRDQFVTVAPLATYAVVVDSAADIYTHRDLEPPVFAGRTITLQERTAAGGWSTVATKPAGTDGRAVFALTAPLLGERILRARAEDVRTRGQQVGWTVSWPTYVRTGLLGDLLEPDDAFFRTTPATDRAAEPLPPETDSTGATDASAQHGWYRPTYDFAWEYGQSLSSPPTRGEVLRGRWVEHSTGSGRVVPFNGALAFQSKLIHKGPGDRGTTSATVTGNAQRFGRWEFRIWQNVFEEDGRDFRMRVELVPEGAAAGACAAESVRVADMELGARSYDVGLRSSQQRGEWARTVPDSPAWSGLHNFAVEVAPDHVTWFFDGRAVASTARRTPVLGKALVPRVSMVGADRGVEHNGAQFSVDWVRAWTLETGRQSRAGGPLSARDYSPTC